MDYLICVVFLIVAGSLTDGQSGSSSFSLKIISPTTEDVEVNNGDEITIKCKGDSNLRWKYPTESQNLADIKTDIVNGEYFSELKKSHANISDVGYYYCFDEKNNNVSVYVYVNGTGHLFLDPQKYAVTAYQYTPVIIPCRTAQKNLDVYLSHNGQAIDLHANQWKYDNKIGFIHERGTIQQNGGYDCCAKDECEYFNLEVLKHTDNAPKPVLNRRNIIVSVGDNVTLVCSVKAEEIIKFQTNWIFPYKNESIWNKYELTNKQKFSSNKYVRFHEEVLTLKIYNVSTEDEGIFVCQVRDHMLNVNNQSATLLVMEEGDTILKIKEGTVKNIAVSVHENPNWIIEYAAYPAPTVQWFGPHDNEISNSTKYIIVQTPEMIKLEILNAALNDSGTYHLEVNNGVKEELQLNLTVSSTI